MKFKYKWCNHIYEVTAETEDYAYYQLCVYITNSISKEELIETQTEIKIEKRNP